MYTKNGLDTWIDRWIKKDWKSSTGAAVANQDLWKRLTELRRDRNMDFRYVKAHCGIQGNEGADKLAVDAASRASRLNE